MDRSRRSPSLADLIARFRRVRVLVVGDLMLDQFIWGRVERISPEAPVPVVHVTSESFRLGGAANVARNIHSLGGRSTICGVIGRDSAGRRIRDGLTEIGTNADGVFATRDTVTTRKTRIIAHQQQVVRLDREGDVGQPSRAIARARAFVLGHLREADVVVISDYGKGMINADLLRRLAEEQQRRPFRIIVDPKQSNFPHYRRVTLVTPNRDEASRASGIDIRDEGSLLQAGQALLERWQAEAVLITRGEHGMSLFRGDMPAFHFPTVARHVYDVTGAGDTVVATLAIALGAGADLETAAVLANHAAGVVVGEVGTATIDLDRLALEVGVPGSRGRGSTGPRDRGFGGPRGRA